MAKWYVVKSGAVLRECEAPDKDTATGRLLPLQGGRVVSAASWALSDHPKVRMTQRCGYGCGRESEPDAKACRTCAAQRLAHRVAAPKAEAPSVERKRVGWPKGRAMTPEHRAKISDAMKGRPLAPAHAAAVKAGNAVRNREPWSEARKRNASAGQRKAWAKRTPEERAEKLALMRTPTAMAKSRQTRIARGIARRRSKREGRE